MTLAVFAAYLSPGMDAPDLISEEMQEHSKCQVMSLSEANKVGIKGIPDHPQGGTVKVVVASRRDVSWITRALDSHPAVSSYDWSEVDT